MTGTATTCKSSPRASATPRATGSSTRSIRLAVLSVLRCVVCLLGGAWCSSFVRRCRCFVPTATATYRHLAIRLTTALSPLLLVSALLHSNHVVSYTFVGDEFLPNPNFHFGAAPASVAAAASGSASAASASGAGAGAAGAGAGRAFAGAGVGGPKGSVP